MRDRYQLDADTGRRQRAQTRLADGDERLDPIRHLRDAQILGLGRHFRLERGLTAAPATRLAAFGPAGRYAITDRRDAIGAGLRERPVENAAEGTGDRKRDAEGKSVAVRGETGGRRRIKKQ